MVVVSKVGVLLEAKQAPIVVLPLTTRKSSTLTMSIGCAETRATGSMIARPLMQTIKSHSVSSNMITQGSSCLNVYSLDDW